MSAGESGEDWWTLSSGYVAVLRVFLVAFAGFSVFCAFDPLWGRTASSTRFAVAVVAFCYLFGRLVVTAVAIRGDVLVVRRLFPGWAECMPAYRVVRCYCMSLDATDNGTSCVGMLLLGWFIAPANIQGSYRRSSRIGRGTPKLTGWSW